MSKRFLRAAALGSLTALAGGACGPDAAGPAQADTGTDAVPSAPAIPTAEYAARRARILETLPDGILLLHARPAEKGMEQWGFVQDPTFLYYSGLSEVPGAIVALDGPAGASHLFLPPAPEFFGMTVEGLVPEPGAATAQTLGFDTARPWSDFLPWVRSRMTEGVETLYVDEPRRPEATGLPPELRPVAGRNTLWRTTVTEAFPDAEVRGAGRPVMEQRAVKSEREIAILEVNALRTAASLLAVAGRLAPDVRQRETEGAMVEACLSAGGQGPSFWPWTMSGPNAHVTELPEAFFRYGQGDRIARTGELVRVDIGCAGGLYGADVGRTLPVSGAFSPDQAEAWDLLITGYRAGLEAMGDGVPVSRVREASMEAIRAARSDLTTPTGQAAAEAILSGGEGTWHIHGVGIDSGEDLPPVLLAGMVVAYEPGFSVGDDAYYLEDMIVVTADGHRVLSTGLPYTAEEIATVMAGR